MSSTAIIKPNAAGAEAIIHQLVSGDPPKAGNIVRIAGDPLPYVIKDAGPEGSLTIDPPLRIDLEAHAAGSIYESMDELEDIQIDALADDLHKMESAIERAREIAAETQKNRVDAEKAHADRVADFLLNDAGKIPAKPSTLSAAQAADDSADAALEVLSKRKVEIENRLRILVISSADRRIREQYKAASSAAWSALHDLADAMARLHDAVGVSRARSLIEQVGIHIPAELGERWRNRLQPAGDLYGRIGLRSPVDATHGDNTVMAEWPTNASAARIGAKGGAK